MTPAELFDAFTRASVSRDPEAFLDLFTEDGELILPFADLAYRGKPAIRARIGEQWKSSPIRVKDFADRSVLATPDFAVAEYTVHVEVAGQAFAVKGILRLVARDGRIQSFREYLDPTGLAAIRPARQILRKVYDAMQAKSADRLADLFAIDGIHEFGFRIPNRPHQLLGREAVRESYTAGWKNHPLEISAIEDELVFAGADPEIVVGQWRGSATRDGSPVSITGLLILRVRNHEIVHCYDFMDSAGIARALGRPPFSSSGTGN
ncbi:MAG: nuclear transport factor 2 family protein [Kofleriaceae bacterium]